MHLCRKLPRNMRDEMVLIKLFEEEKNIIPFFKYTEGDWVVILGTFQALPFSPFQTEPQGVV